MNGATFRTKESERVYSLNRSRSVIQGGRNGSPWPATTGHTRESRRNVQSDRQASGLRVDLVDDPWLVRWGDGNQQPPGRIVGAEPLRHEKLKVTEEPWVDVAVGATEHDHIRTREST